MAEQYSPESQQLAQLAETRKVAESFRELAKRVLPKAVYGEAKYNPQGEAVHGEHPMRLVTFSGRSTKDRRGSYDYFELQDELRFGYLEPMQFDRQMRRRILSNQDESNYGVIGGLHELSMTVRHTYEYDRVFTSKHEVLFMRDDEQVNMDAVRTRVIGLDGSWSYDEDTDDLFDDIISDHTVEGNGLFFSSLLQQMDGVDKWRSPVRRLIDGALQDLDSASSVIRMRHAAATAQEMLAHY